MRTRSKYTSRNRRKARENACDQVVIGFGFASNWLNRWRELFKPITERNKAKPKQGVGSERVLKCICLIVSILVQVVFTKAVRAKGYHSQNAPHAFKFKENAADPYERQIGTQVLLDILLLAKCDHFLHTESSVASLASYFNPHMTSYFLDEMNSVKVCLKLR